MGRAAKTIMRATRGAFHPEGTDVPPAWSSSVRPFASRKQLGDSFKTVYGMIIMVYAAD
jgi:hypothetical protein